MTEIQKIAAALLERKEKKTPSGKDFLSSGSTLLNLAVSGRIDGGWLMGKFFLLPGGSNSGKTWLILEAFAQASISKTFDKHQLIYNAPEFGADMDLQKCFGSAMAKRTKRRHSETVEDFYFDLHDSLKQGPCIYALDSMDALSTGDEEKKFTQHKKAAKGDGQAKGSYGTSKAKLNSAGIRQMLHLLQKTKSILFVICQTRDNIGFGSMFKPKTRSGGHALTFYANTEVWLDIVTRLKGKYGLSVGTLSKLQVKRTRLTGKDRTVYLPILNTCEQPGIDEVGSMVDWLVEWKHWSKQGSDEEKDRLSKLIIDKGLIKAPEFKADCSREKLVTKIEGNDKEQELRELVGRVWAEIEEACSVQRKRRYE